MKKRYVELGYWLLALLPLVCTLVCLPSLPERVPMHWNAAGEIDGWGQRSAALLMPFMIIGLNAMFLVLPKIDPKRKNYEGTGFAKGYHAFRLIFNLFMLLMTAITLYSAYNPNALHVEMLVPAASGALLCAMGNYMPKFKHNYFVGIKTPWTLASEEVWRSTHRLGGALWFWGGLLLIAVAFLLPGKAVAPATILITSVIVFVPIGYSYLAYRKAA